MMTRPTTAAFVLLVTIITLTALARPAAAQAEAALGAQLCAAAQGDIRADSRIALAPPAAAQSPLPVAEIEAVMSRAAQAMCADWPTKPRILAGSTELRGALALVLNRQGSEAWQQTIQSTVRQEADYVLVGETGLSGGEISLRLTLVDLSDGRVIVKTSDIALKGIARSAGGDPRAAIGAAIDDFIDLLPESRDDVTVGPFANEASGLETLVGRNLSDMAVEAWLGSANSITALLHDAPPARLRRGPPPAIGYYLDGTIRLIDRDRFQLVLRLSQDGALRASRTLDLSSLQMPRHLRSLLDPAHIRVDTGLDGIASALSSMAGGRLALTAAGGRGGVYPICRATDAVRVPTDCPDSLIQLTLLADLSGEVSCFSLDESGHFYIILPAQYAPETRLTASQPLILPDDLPSLPGGNRVYWPAMGAPAETLLGCLVYPILPDPMKAALDDLDGTWLTQADRLDLLAILRDGGPLAATAVLVRISNQTLIK